VILMYHRVAEPAFDPWGLAVSPGCFREQMAMLAAERTVMPLDALVQALEAGNCPRYATAITFDDGYRDNLTSAAPILAESGLVAICFVSTGRIGAERPFWWDELAALVPERGRYRAEWRRLSRLSDAEQTAELDAFSRPALNCASDDALPMDARMLREAAEGPLTIGCHAQSHAPLTALPPRERQAEIAGARADLAQLLGAPPSGFAYPHGAWDEATAAMVAEAGFAWAVAVENRAVPRRAKRYALPRLTVGDWSAARLRHEIRAAGG
jgi:peptidoglycan/xylan/chitin deacetylase (PgdA/CDA1 family)